MARKLTETEKKMIYFNRPMILEELSELQADLEDFTNDELIEHRDVMLERVNSCLKLMLETDEDNVEVNELQMEYTNSLDYDINERITKYLVELGLPPNKECIDYIRDNWIDDHEESITSHFEESDVVFEIDKDDVEMYWQEYIKHSFGGMEIN